MNERIYRIMDHSGTASIVIGIVVMVTGIVSGILLLIHGGMLVRG